jgi:glutaminase
MAPCNAASIGDIESLNRFSNLNIDFKKGDYDYRTPLHLAAANGHL